MRSTGASRALAPLSLAGAALTFLAAITLSCVSYVDVASRLNNAVGQRLDEVVPSAWAYRRLVTQDQLTMTYLIGNDPAWRCAWEFTVSRETELIESWRYPNADAKHWCTSVPATRP
jgi:hypothetical protein